MSPREEDRGVGGGQRWPTGPRLTRRRMVAGAGVVGVPLAWGGKSAAVRGGRESTRWDVAAAATPEATPGASPVAAQGLEIIREQRPVYPGKPRLGGVLRLHRPGPGSDDFSPVAFRQDFQVPVSYLDPLLRPDEVTLEPRPWLAESWELSAAGREITYRLRGDVRWHDGTPLTADDVQFSFTVYRDDVDSGVVNFFAGMGSVEALDDRTVRVRLEQPDGGWLFNASSQLIFQAARFGGYWSSRSRGERTLTGFDWRDRPPIGTGPWRIVDWTDDRVELERNEGYWAGPPSFEQMVVGWEPRAEARLSAWRGGKADVLWPVEAAEVDRIDDEPGRLYAADAASVMFAAFNFANPLRVEPGIFADVRVRRALSLAIDREGYAREVFGSFIRQRAAGTVAQPWANDRELTNPRRDLAAAEELLAEAGWQDYDGDGTLDDPLGQRFVISAILRDDSRPELEAVLRSIRRDLGEVGVELTVESLSDDRFRERWLESREFDLIAFAYDLFPGFTDFDLYGSAWDVRFNPQGFNPGGYANDEADAAIDEWLRATEIEAQRAALRRLQRAVDDDLFGLWLGFPRESVLVARDVLGFQPNKVWQTADTRKLWRAAESADG